LLDLSPIDRSAKPDDEPQAQLDLQEIREKLAGARGKDFWRSLDEVAETPAFEKFLEDEFPYRKDIPGLERRDFLKLMGASMLMAGLAGCRMLPHERIVPYVKAPVGVVPGRPMFYATAWPFRGYGEGLLVEQYEGRPIKVEGNPAHPSSLGASTALAQASILGLYDPDRARNVIYGQEVKTWEEFFAAAHAELAQQKATQGTGVRILTETVTSPTLAAQIRSFLAAFPGAKWHQYEPVARDSVRLGARMAFGRDVDTIYDFSSAERILSLECDFLVNEPGSQRYAREFIAKRVPEGPNSAMNRLYVVDSTPTLAGAMADHRLPAKASEIDAIARALYQRLAPEAPALGAQTPGVPGAWLDAVVEDLQMHRGRSLVLVGEHQPPHVHALGHAINAILGNVGRTVRYVEPVEAEPVEQMESLRDLVEAMSRGEVNMLLIFGGNPVYDAPADLNFGQALENVLFTFKLGLELDETAVKCKWFAPEAHYLESWGDIRAHDGTVSVIQPLILPLYGGRTASEVLAALLKRPTPGYDLVRQTARSWPHEGDFEAFWQQVLSEGVVAGTASPEVQPQLDSGLVAKLPAPARSEGIEINFRPDHSLWDGRFANNGWLQELPKPLTTVTWDACVYLSPSMAQERQLQNGDIVKVESGMAAIEGPVFIMPGHPKESLTLNLGFGRWATGTIGSAEPGYYANRLRTSRSPWLTSGAQLTKTGNIMAVAAVQSHWSMEGRDIVRMGDLATMRENPNFKPEHDEGDPKELGMTLYDDQLFEGGEDPQWGMTVDLGACIGCNACVTACQAENNIPTVGKRQVVRHREMHWIRIDRYYGPRNGSGDLDNPTTLLQPMLCQHCENAPCEPVCPVAATTHSRDGLNQMVYNRCVGTRYCSNNCPYKVRRFNYLNYTDNNPQFSNVTMDIKHVPGPMHSPKASGISLLKLLNNPDVTVRGRGVMEKCTYCVQRISEARIKAKKEQRPIADGEVMTACQQACPTRAITFGNIRDKGSAVSKMKANPRHYGVLTMLNTRPRTTYLARVLNPNERIPK